VNSLDVQMAETLQYLDIPFSIVVTKRDKLNQSQTHAIETAAKEAFGVHDDELYVVSSLKGRGIERLKGAMETMIQLVKAQDN
jgi:GTP-binding protein EngB required for normal cell division